MKQCRKLLYNSIQTKAVGLVFLICLRINDGTLCAETEFTNELCYVCYTLLALIVTTLIILTGIGLSR